MCMSTRSSVSYLSSLRRLSLSLSLVTSRCHVTGQVSAQAAVPPEFPRSPEMSLGSDPSVPTGLVSSGPCSEGPQQSANHDTGRPKSPASRSQEQHPRQCRLDRDAPSTWHFLHVLHPKIPDHRGGKLGNRTGNSTRQGGRVSVLLLGSISVVIEKGIDRAGS